MLLVLYLILVNGNGDFSLGKCCIAAGFSPWKVPRHALMGVSSVTIKSIFNLFMLGGVSLSQH